MSDIRKYMDIITEGEVLPFKTDRPKHRPLFKNGSFVGWKSRPVGEPKYSNQIRVLKTDDGFVVFIGNEKYGVYNDPAKAHSVALNLQDKLDDDY